MRRLPLLLAAIVAAAVAVRLAGTSGRRAIAQAGVIAYQRQPVTIVPLTPPAGVRAPSPVEGRRVPPPRAHDQRRQ